MIEVTMDLEPVPKREFMAKYERYEPLVKDSTAFMALKTCARKYFYQIVLGRTANDTAIYFAWGSAYHKFRQVLEQEYGIGPNAPKKYDKEIALKALEKAVEAGRAYWKKHAKPVQLGEKFDFMTEARLLKSFLVAFKHWEKEKMQGAVVVIAVEQPFVVQLKDGSYRGGTADQIIRWAGKVWGRDFKTTTKDAAFYQRGLDPNDQFTGYTLAEQYLCGERVQGQFVEVLYNDKPTKKDERGPEIFDFQTSRTPFQLDQFEKEVAVQNRALKIYREEDTWPMQEVNCPFCPYHSVCSKGTEAGMMAQLEAFYHVRPWDYTKVGTDL